MNVHFALGFEVLVLSKVESGLESNQSEVVRIRLQAGSGVVAVMRQSPTRRRPSNRGG